MKRDFAALAARLLQSAETLLPQWFPAGRWRGHEFVLGDLYGSAGDSLSINANSGAWADFADKDHLKGGDLIALYAAAHGLDQAKAYDELNDGRFAPLTGDANAASSRKPERDKWTPLLPVPDSARMAPNIYHRAGPKDAAGKTTWIKREAVARWAYRDRDDKLLGYTCRFEWDEINEEDGEVRRVKDIVPQVYAENTKGKREWRWRSMPVPRPLYNLRELHERPAAPVMLVEGEKKVEALRTLAPQYVGVAWPGGINARDKADWSVLSGRHITCWPDNDEVGIAGMFEIANKHLMPRSPMVKIIIPDGMPPKWDAADALAEGWDWDRLKAWAVPRVQLIREDGNGSRVTETSGAKRGKRGEESRPGADVDGDGDRVDDESGRRSHVVPAEDHETASHSVRSVQRDVGAETSESAISSATGSTALEPAARADDRGSAAGSRSSVEPRVELNGGEHHELDRLGASSHVSDRDGDAGDRVASRSDAQIPAGGHRTRADGERQARVFVGGAASTSAAGTIAVEASGQSQVARWLSWGLDRNGNGLPIANLNNAVRILEHDAALRDIVWFDEFLQRLRTGDPARDWIDADDANLQLYIQRVIGIPKIGADHVRGAVLVIAYRSPRDSLREFVEALPEWDGVERCASFFADVFGARESTYCRAVGVNFWNSLIARALVPGCKVDNMVVLEGAQGKRKSSALAAIVGDAWFAEASEAVTDKDFFVNLQGKWIIEIAELDAFRAADITSIKRMVTCRIDRFRPPYGRSAVDHPRRSILSGTANHDDWNRDETGARRFWPIACGRGFDIRVDLIEAGRLQYMAEARAQIASGASWWEMPTEETLKEQRRRYDADPWLEVVSEFVLGRSEVRVTQILLDCLKIELGRISKADQMRAARCLTALGWWNGGNVKRDGRVVKIWRPASDEGQGSLLNE